MGVAIQTPAIAPGTTEERLQQIQTYLYKTAQQLQWAFDNIQTTGGSGGTGTAVAAPGAPQGAQQGGGQTPEQVFADIKNLIIKSADIVTAYSTIIEKKLEGVYASQSDFGTFREETSNKLRQTDKDITQLYTNTQTIGNTVDGLYDQVNETSAYIKTGYLADAPDGTPIYGLEIGQQNSIDGQPTFDKFARFSAGRLSFFDQNDTEVAYVSDYKLYITNAEITGTLRLSGKFKIYYNNGLAFQWTGGGK